MTKLQRTNQEAWHDLVAHTEHQRAGEHIVTQRYRRAHGNHVARKQAQLHAGLALRDAVAHGGHATSHLHGGTLSACLRLEQIRVMRERCMSRKHVVVGGDDANVRRLLSHHPQLVIGWQGGKRMRHIGTTQPLSTRRAPCVGVQLRQVSATCGLTALDDALRDGVNGGIEFHNFRKCW